ncbi:tyrosine-type recombinase/integrase, partial [Shewanella algae]|uniref:tyrosine-type recombinase/integrase n=1 Tax=Shewanella algae TaxID=38313 RepID=UPI0039E9F40F
SSLNSALNVGLVFFISATHLRKVSLSLRLFRWPNSLCHYTGTIPMREPDIHRLLTWYMSSVRQTIILRRNGKGDGYCAYDDETYLLSNLMFPSEQGGIICPNTFRKRLNAIAANVPGLTRKVTPHTLRHTGCTLMVPLYSPEIAQKYMRHKNLYTTLGYYHPTVLDAASEPNAAFDLFDEEED